MRGVGFSTITHAVERLRNDIADVGWRCDAGVDPTSPQLRRDVLGATVRVVLLSAARAVAVRRGR